ALVRTATNSRHDDWARLPAAPSPAGGPHAHAATPIKKMHRLLRGRYAIALSLAVAGASAGCVWGYVSQHPKYRSQGMIEIQPVVKQPMADDKLMATYQQYVQNQVAFLQNMRVIGMALSSPEWTRTGRGNDPDVQTAFLDNLDVQILPGTTVIKVSYLDADP